MTKLILSTILFSFFFTAKTHCQNVVSLSPFSNVINGVVDNSIAVFSTAQQNSLFQKSLDYSGLSKVYAVDGTPAVYYSSTNFWPQGSWGRGYAPGIVSPQSLPSGVGSASSFYAPINGVAGKHWSPDPLVRDAQEFLSGHIYQYLSGINVSANLSKIKQGIDYLLSEQTPSGGYIYWGYRQTQINMSTDDYYDASGNLVNLNKTSEYSTSKALTVLSEFYSSGIDYRRNEVLTAMLFAKTFLLQHDWGCDANNNVRGLGLWGLTAYYKATKDCSVMNMIRSLTARMITEQSSSGQWETGGIENEYTYNGTFQHDVKNHYHFMILRGLIEAFSVLPTGDPMATAAVNVIKKGFNNVIDFRLKPDVRGILSLISVQGPNGATIPITSNGYYNYESGSLSYYTETFIKLAYYANGNYHFSDSERQTLNNLMGMSMKWLDLRERYSFRSVAMYSLYWPAMQQKKKVLGWGGDAPNYTISRITGKAVSGDFDNDGTVDDIAAFCGFGSMETAIHVWKNNSGSSLEFQGDKTAWFGNQMDASKIVGRVVSGDFDSDGFEDDIAVLYDNGNNNISVWVYKSDGSAFSTYNYYINSNFNPSKVTNRMVSGDFDNDGFKDDIAMFYSYGGNATTAWILKGNISSFSSTYNYYSTTTEFNANNVTGNMVSGDFDNDGFYDDVMTFYDYGNGTSKAICFKSNGSIFQPSDFWYGNDYPANSASLRYVSGDFDRDGWHDDIAAMTYTGPTNMRIWVFRSLGSSLTSQLYYETSTYVSQNVTGRVVSGDFNNNGFKDGIMAAYDFGNGADWHSFQSYRPPLLKSIFFVYSQYWYQNSNNCSTDFSYLGDCGKSMGIKNDEFTTVVNDKKNGRIISPNPVNDFLNINLNDEITDVIILDNFGRMVFKTQDKRFSVEELSSGTYFIEIRTNSSGVFHERFIKH